MSQEEISGGQPAQKASAPIASDAANGEDSRIVSRRWLLFKAGIALNGLVGIVLAVPIVRYLFAPWRKDESFNSWVSLGAIDAFPTGETRLAFYKNPSGNSWDACGRLRSITPRSTWSHGTEIMLRTSTTWPVLTASIP